MWGKTNIRNETVTSNACRGHRSKPVIPIGTAAKASAGWRRELYPDEPGTTVPPPCPPRVDPRVFPRVRAPQLEAESTRILHRAATASSWCLWPRNHERVELGRRRIGERAATSHIPSVDASVFPEAHQHAFHFVVFWTRSPMAESCIFRAVPGAVRTAVARRLCRPPKRFRSVDRVHADAHTGHRYSRLNQGQDGRQVESVS